MKLKDEIIDRHVSRYTDEVRSLGYCFPGDTEPVETFSPPNSLAKGDSAYPEEANASSSLGLEARRSQRPRNPKT